MRKALTIFAVLLLLIGVTPVMGAGKAKASSSPSISININTANVAQLTKLPGIGPKKARRIIETRKKLGRFKRIEDIMKVKGIGEKTFQRIKHMIRVK